MMLDMLISGWMTIALLQGHTEKAKERERERRERKWFKLEVQ